MRWEADVIINQSLSDTTHTRPAAEDQRFGFGENWKSFLAGLDEARIAEAEKSLQWLIGRERLDNVRFLDVGSGSGLSSLAARRLARRGPLSITSAIGRVHDDVARPVLSRRCELANRARLDPRRRLLAKLGRFEVVYSWGVLHHTGAMHEAIENASRLVGPGGLFVVALYRKTRLCWFWSLEKRWYCKASSRAQAVARGAYVALMRLAFTLLGRDFNAHVADYRSKRGMDYIHDVHDWLGGYPYESIRPADVARDLGGLGFAPVRSKVQLYSTGLFGSGCDEYVFRRTGGGCGSLASLAETAI